MSLDICHKGHDSVCFDVSVCPACEAIEEKDSEIEQQGEYHEVEIRNLQIEHEREIQSLKDEISLLRDRLATMEVKEA